MSDAESTHSETHSMHTMRSHVSHNSMRTEGLYDHRNQASNLPIRSESGASYDLPPPAIRLGTGPAPRAGDAQPAAAPLGSHRVRLPSAIGPPDDDSDDDNDFAIQDSPILHANTSIRSNNNARPSRLSNSIAENTQANATSHLAPGSNPIKKIRSRTRSHSFTDQLRAFKNANFGAGTDDSPVLNPLNKSVSRNSDTQHQANFDRRRRLTRASMDSGDAGSHGSRESQETEEDVCFPMLPDHVKINGIDFDEIQEFINESRIEDEALLKERNYINASSDSSNSTAAKKYTPLSTSDEEVKIHDNSSTENIAGQDGRAAGHANDNTDNIGVSFGNNRVEGEEVPPDRFSFFCSENEETVHAPDLQSLVKPGESVRSLFNSGKPTWWLDCSCPTDAEMKVLAKTFGIHPLTAEDIRMQETREKVELFRDYYFVCFHTFESDKESEEFLEPINVYIVVFREGVLTFHFSPISHGANVRRRVRQLRDYVDVSADWLCYALIDDITDSFAPVIQSIEYEADAIEESVFGAREMDFRRMLQRIGESRRKVMTLMRLLSGKADVIKMFAKRCQDEANGIGPALTSNINLANLSSSQQQHHHIQQAQPRGDIALYLGDIQDHVVTMYQNLSSYEKIFSRSHSNYLAQLQVESFNSNNRVTEMLSKVTLIGTVLVPLNLVTGLFGMNVRVPGEGGSNVSWFFGILGVMILIATLSTFGANWWLTRSTRQGEEEMYGEGAGRSILGFSISNRSRNNADNGNNRRGGSRSIISFPSRINRYD